MKISPIYNINENDFNIKSKYRNTYGFNFSYKTLKFGTKADSLEFSTPQYKKEKREFKPKFVKEKAEIEYFLRQNEYSPERIASVISRINGSNLDIVQTICTSESWRDIYDIMNCLNKDNIEFVRKLCFDKEFPKEKISGILSELKDFNMEFAEKLCFDENFPKTIIEEILLETNKDNVHFAERLCFDKKAEHINRNHIGRILSNVNKDNINIAETLCFKKEFSPSAIDDILENVNTTAPNIALIKELLKYDIPEDSISNILWKTKDNKEALIRDKIEYVRLIKDTSMDGFELEYILTNSVFPFAYYLHKASPQVNDAAIKTVKAQKERCLKYPELYCNGVYANYYDYKVKCNHFFENENNRYALLTLANILGAEALNDFLGYRFDVVKEYFAKIQSTLNYNDLKLLKNMVNSKKPNGQNFISKEKTSLIDTLLSYKSLGLDNKKIEQMLSKGCLDTNELHIDILKGLFIKYGLSKQEFDNTDNEILSKWNLKYIQLLEEEMKLDMHHVFLDVIKGANTGDFKNYIHNKQHLYGLANKRTRKEFETYGLNYDAWVNPPQSTITLFKHHDKAAKILSNSAFMITNAIEELRHTPAKEYIDKVLCNYIESGNFAIPEEAARNKEKLCNLVNNILGQLNKVWQRAYQNVHNLTDRQQAAIARRTLSIQFTLSRVKNALQDLQKVESKKNINQTIKMWDRNPQKDLFQGNYSNCCIGINKSNGNVMPSYLLNTMFNMMEIIDNDSGETIGNALVYYAKDKKNQPYFVIDNIEIHNHYRKTSDIELELRDAITEFAQKINIAVTKKADTPIIIGEEHNDITLAYLQNLSEELSPIGSMECKEMYLDLFGGRQFDVNSIKKQVEFFDLLHPICK